MTFRFCRKDKYNSLFVPLTHFQPMFHFYTPRKHQNTRAFQMFSGGIEVEQSVENGLIFLPLALKETSVRNFS